MARPRRTPTSRSTGDYRHEDARRKNNPPVGMVAYEAKTAEQPQAHYGYDPHLSPQLIWAGKPGLVSIEVEDSAGLKVDTVSLHIHERVSTQAIIHAVQKPQALQLDLFADPRPQRHAQRRPVRPTHRSRFPPVPARRTPADCCQGDRSEGE